MQILYEDNHIIVINKSPSEIVQGDKSGDIPLSEKIKIHIKEKYHKPGGVYLGIIHRLDRPVSGVIIYAKTTKALSRMNELFRNNHVKKIYWAILTRKPNPEQGVLVNFLEKNEEQNKSYIVDSLTRRSREAKLAYRLLVESDKYYLIEVELFTGRHHQIRAQLAHIGCPIKGDVKYGAPVANKDGSIGLHARRISFIHPIKKVPMLFIAQPPDEKLWNYFLDTADQEIMDEYSEEQND